MKIKKLFIPAILTLLLSGFTLGVYNSESEKNQLILDILMEGLNTSHYAPQKIDDDFSEKVYDLYLEKLDYNKKFLLKSDIESMNKFRKKIDDEINSGTFEFLKLSNNIIQKRISERELVYKEILSKPFDYKINEEYETDAKKISFASGEKEIKNEWRKALQYQTIIRIDDMLLQQEKAKEKKDSSFKILPFDSIEIQARKKVLKANDDWFKRLKKITEKDRFSYYVNSITSVYDPHTEFFPPKEKKEFDQSMSGQMEGIGAKLQQKDGIIKITEIVVGSPSYKQGQLKAGDAIIKVAQGDKEPIEVTDMDLDDAIQLIRGKKGTEVRLTVRKPDGKEVVIPIVRDIIQLEDTFAQSAVLEYENQKIGYIKLPVFYSDFTRNGARRCGEDIKKETVKLVKEGVSSIVIDLRDNGGGSLSEVVDMIGHFITTGPVVQVKKKAGKIETYRDHNPEQIYSGPMVVMINRNSASASEIFAAAMQDYKRAVIIGSGPSSFGKGTVQQFMDLDNYLLPQQDSIKPLGAVKITMQKFYRINGGATQLKGVEPDIELPDAYSEIETGEKELDYPMQWDEIPAADYKKYNIPNMTDIVTKSKERVEKNNTFSLVKDQASYLKKKRNETKYSINLLKYREDAKLREAELKKYDDMRVEIKNYNTRIIKEKGYEKNEDSTKINKDKKWLESLRKDFYLFEATRVAIDIK